MRAIHSQRERERALDKERERFRRVIRAVEDGCRGSGA